MKINILGHGFISLIDFRNNIIHAARQSHQSHDRATPVSDTNLIRQMLHREHMSPFEQAVFWFEIRAPIMVRDHFFTYRMASKVAESWRANRLTDGDFSTRFYVPSPPRCTEEGKNAYIKTASYCVSQYRLALNRGEPPELARMHLNTPGLYTSWDWSFNAVTMMNILSQRLTPGTQWETAEYVRALWKAFKIKLPVVAEAFRELNKELLYDE